MVDTKDIKKPTNKKGAPPAPTVASGNLDKPASGQTVPLQVNVMAELRREFKGYANDHDTSASKLFEEVWRFYKEHYG